MRSIPRSWLVLLPLACGCSNAREENAPPPAPKVAEQKPQPEPINPPPVEAKPVEAKPVEAKPVAAQEPWGTIQGRIVWGGKEIKPRSPIVVKKDHNDYAYCMKNGAFLEETWIIDPKTRGLKNAFVWLAPMEKDGKLTIHPEATTFAPGDENVVIDQPICMFVPHALALREGQSLVVKNSAKVLHNFKWSGHPDINPGGNSTIGAGQQQVLKIKADQFPIGVECGIHPWMKGWIRCFDHPYFDVTPVDGSFTIKDAPVGPHRLIVWHGEGGGLGGRKWKEGRVITVQSGANDLGAIEYPEPKD
ncbi:MAG: hypothetical protein L0Y71_16060 [Gemmataceae bacterium]|nr:hypothetical protein [Gemmataceae bacterium]